MCRPGLIVLIAAGPLFGEEMSVPPRTNPTAVIALLGDDYGPRADGTLPDLTPYIQLASATVDRVRTAALAWTPPFTHSDVELELIERCLAGHNYTKSDPTYSGRAGASFVRGEQEQEPYKNLAVDADASGMLNAVLKRQRVISVWLGKPPSQQIPYDQRN